jgi:putative ABC transport system ATP-binding protein
LIRIRDLSRRDVNTNRLILSSVNITIRAGEQIGLFGPSGSGKSSLLRAIAKLDRCDSGELLYEGHPVCKEMVPRYRRQVIYLPQRPTFVAATVRENLELPFRFAASTSGFDEPRVRSWLAELAIPCEILDQRAESLSGGQQQIIALLRAISLSPRVLLLDEPTASLDADLTERFEQLLRKWQTDGDSSSAQHALVWTSHNVDQVRRMTNRMIEIRDGVLTSGDQDG